MVDEGERDSFDALLEKLESQEDIDAEDFDRLIQHECAQMELLSKQYEQALQSFTSRKQELLAMKSELERHELNDDESKDKGTDEEFAVSETSVNSSPGKQKKKRLMKRFVSECSYFEPKHSIFTPIGTKPKAHNNSLSPLSRTVQVAEGTVCDGEVEI